MVYKLNTKITGEILKCYYLFTECTDFSMSADSDMHLLYI
ncbi:hypothetical protein Mpsy_3123 [Methanolobus psychrophilus R15]|nr:hypothetical protein Mpsy_3123 [Methanolobus psychrophilus R15]